MTDQLFTIAESYEPKIRAALNAAFAQIKDSVTLSQIENAMREGGVSAVYDILNDLQIEGIIEENIVDSLNNAIIESGRITYTDLPVGVKTGQVFRYNLINPATAEYVRNYELNLIRLIGSNTRTAIRNNIEAAVISGKNPKAIARGFRDTIGLTPNQEKIVASYRKALENRDINALDRVLRDKRFDSTVIRSIKDKKPLTPAQIDNMVNRYREKYIKYRSETIARTEALRATSVGDYTSVIQAIQDGAVDGNILRKFWVYTQGGRTRQAHRAIPGLNPGGVPAEGMFITPLGPMRFPRDPNGTASNTINCRCVLTWKMVEPDIANINARRTGSGVT